MHATRKQNSANKKWRARALAEALAIDEWGKLARELCRTIQHTQKSVAIQLETRLRLHRAFPRHELAISVVGFKGGGD